MFNSFGMTGDDDDDDDDNNDDGYYSTTYLTISLCVTFKHVLCPVCVCIIDAW